MMATQLAKHVLARDLIWRPVALGKIVAAINATADHIGKPRHRMRVLCPDAGTGVYASVLAAKFNVTVMEDDPDLWSRLSGVMANSGGERVLGTLCENVALLDDSFDCIVAPTTFQIAPPDELKQMFKTAWRVLRPGGTLIVISIDHTQLIDGFWYASLLPNAARQLSLVLNTNSTLMSTASHARLTIDSLHVNYSPLVMRDIYKDPASFLAKWYRDGDLLCQLASDDELKQACHEILEMHEANSLQTYFDMRDRVRRVVGQSTTLVFSVPMACKYDYERAYQNPVLIKH